MVIFSVEQTDRKTGATKTISVGQAAANISREMPATWSEFAARMELESGSGVISTPNFNYMRVS